MRQEQNANSKTMLFLQLIIMYDLFKYGFSLYIKIWKVTKQQIFDFVTPASLGAEGYPHALLQQSPRLRILLILH